MEVDAMNAAMELYETKDEEKFLALCKEKGIEVKVISDKDYVKTFRVYNVVDAVLHYKPGKPKSVSIIVVPN
jgi:hypothetical protein